MPRLYLPLVHPVHLDILTDEMLSGQTIIAVRIAERLTEMNVRWDVAFRLNQRTTLQPIVLD